MGYTDAPDGKECFHKMYEVSKRTGFVGVILATYDTLMITKPQGYVPTIATYLKTCVPFVASGLTFAAVTCTACNVRGKDDKLNYFAGGASAGSIFGIAARSIKLGFPVALGLGGIAMLYKDSKDNGWEFFPRYPRKFGGFDLMNEDYTRCPKV